MKKLCARCGKTEYAPKVRRCDVCDEQICPECAQEQNGWRVCKDPVACGQSKSKRRPSGGGQ